VLGSTVPANTVVNEMTTVVSVWTHNQFIDGTAIKGNPQNRRRQRVEFRRSADRRMRHRDPRRNQQHSNNDDGKPRHIVESTGWLHDAS
jgi:hypothetical protein